MHVSASISLSLLSDILTLMRYIVAGLGNPGEEYAHTRHNIGRMVVEHLASMLGASGWRDDAKSHACVAEAVTPTGDDVTLILPDNYMNRSGGSISPFIKNKTQIEGLVVVHDDIDLPLGTIKIVFDRGSGGHRGVESIVRTLKTRAFTRVRVGVLPTTPTGKVRKPKGEDKVHTFILAPIQKKDTASITAAVEQAARAVHACIVYGRDVAMRTYNGAQRVA